MDDLIAYRYSPHKSVVTVMEVLVRIRQKPLMPTTFPKPNSNKLTKLSIKLNEEKTLNPAFTLWAFLRHHKLFSTNGTILLISL